MKAKRQGKALSADVRARLSRGRGVPQRAMCDLEPAQLRAFCSECQQVVRSCMSAGKRTRHARQRSEYTICPDYQVPHFSVPGLVKQPRPIRKIFFQAAPLLKGVPMIRSCAGSQCLPMSSSRTRPSAVLKGGGTRVLLSRTLAKRCARSHSGAGWRNSIRALGAAERATGCCLPRRGTLASVVRRRHSAAHSWRSASSNPSSCRRVGVGRR